MKIINTYEELQKLVNDKNLVAEDDIKIFSIDQIIKEILKKRKEKPFILYDSEYGKKYRNLDNDEKRIINDSVKNLYNHISYHRCKLKNEEETINEIKKLVTDNIQKYEEELVKKEEYDITNAILDIKNRLR